MIAMMYGKGCMKVVIIVTDDKHYKPLRQIAYPKLFVVKLMEFVEMLHDTK